MYQKDLKIKKIFSIALENHQKNNFKEAEDLYKEILKLNPNHADVHNNLGLIFQESGERKKAIGCYQKAIQIKPDNADSYSNLGLIFQELREHQKAMGCYQKAIQIKPYHLNAYFNLGLVFQELREHQKAIGCFQKSIKIKSDHADSYSKLGNVFKELGKLEKAVDSYKKATEYEPENLVNYYYLSDLKKEILDLNLKNKINKIIKNEKSKKNTAYGNFLLSRYEFQNKNYKEEFNYLLKGHYHYFESRNKQYKKQVEYWLNELPNKKELFNLNNSKKSEERINYKIKPIFIIGTPRCGSTLIEKIVASGAKSIPTGEETEIINFYIKQDIFEKKSFNLDIKKFENKIIEKYKEKNLIKKENDYIFTDKSLDNFFYLSLIKKIFPAAKIINCKRNSLSSIISIIKNNIAGLAWAHSLENIFKYFDTYYKIIEIYNKKFPNFIYELEFEKFVNNPEIESKKLMKYCDLPWSKKCLKFYKRKDLISQTASNIQIRKAIYKQSTQKYLPYKKLLNDYKNKYYWFN